PRRPTRPRPSRRSNLVAEETVRRSGSSARMCGDLPGAGSPGGRYIPGAFPMRATLRRLLAVAVLAAIPALAQAAPIPAGPNKGESPMAAARKALDEVGDMNYQAKTLNDLITDLKEKTKVPVILDNQVFNFGLDPNQPIINVNLKQVKLKDGLKAALAP